MIGGVLTYKNLGTRNVCGSTIGADGSGEFAFVIEGSADDAWQWAKAHLARVECPRNRIVEVRLVLAEEGYGGRHDGNMDSHYAATTGPRIKSYLKVLKTRRHKQLISASRLRTSPVRRRPPPLTHLRSSVGTLSHSPALTRLRRVDAFKLPAPKL